MQISFAVCLQLSWDWKRFYDTDKHETKVRLNTSLFDVFSQKEFLRYDCCGREWYCWHFLSFSFYGCCNICSFLFFSFHLVFLKAYAGDLCSGFGLLVWDFFLVNVLIIVVSLVWVVVAGEIYNCEISFLFCKIFLTVVLMGTLTYRVLKMPPIKNHHISPLTSAKYKCQKLFSKLHSNATSA